MKKFSNYRKMIATTGTIMILASTVAEARSMTINKPLLNLGNVTTNSNTAVLAPVKPVLPNLVPPAPMPELPDFTLEGLDDEMMSYYDAVHFDYLEGVTVKANFDADVTITPPDVKKLVKPPVDMYSGPSNNQTVTYKAEDTIVYYGEFAKYFDRTFIITNFPPTIELIKPITASTASTNPATMLKFVKTTDYDQANINSKVTVSFDESLPPTLRTYTYKVRDDNDNMFALLVPVKRGIPMPEDPDIVAHGLTDLKMGLNQLQKYDLLEGVAFGTNYETSLRIRPVDLSQWKLPKLGTEERREVTYAVEDDNLVYYGEGRLDFYRSVTLSNTAPKIEKLVDYIPVKEAADNAEDMLKFIKATDKEDGNIIDQVKVIWDDVQAKDRIYKFEVTDSDGNTTIEYIIVYDVPSVGKR